ncbi:MAG: LCP family protein [Chloroflexia bacterium]
MPDPKVALASPDGAGPGLPAAGPVPIQARPRKRGRWLLWTLLTLLVVLIVSAGYGGILVWQFTNTIYKQNNPPPFRSATPEVAAAAISTPRPTQVPGQPTWTPEPTRTPVLAETLPPGRINILLLGTDKRAELQDVAARSDTMIILSVDPEQKTAGILSVPRDLQVTMPGYGLQRINAAYFFGEYDKLPGGGPILAVSVVSSYFNVPVPYYVTVNFDAFQKIVDQVGGIDIVVPEELDDPDYPGPYNSTIHIHFDAGCQHMDGERALEYARTRHPDSDFGRARRQQQVIGAIRQKALSLNMLTSYPDLLRQLGNSIETNIPPDKQFAFAQLAGEIKTPDIYTAQIDSTMVTELPDGALNLRKDQAKPMLDWFFGRGIYANMRPGTGIKTFALPTGTETSAAAEPSFPTPPSALRPIPTEPPTSPPVYANAPPALATALSDMLPPGKCR